MMKIGDLNLTNDQYSRILFCRLPEMRPYVDWAAMDAAGIDRGELPEDFDINDWFVDPLDTETQVDALDAEINRLQNLRDSLTPTP